MEYEIAYNQNMKVPIGKAAEEIGVSINTLRRWEAKGIIHPERTPGNHRLYDLEELRMIVSNNGECKIKTKRLTIAYARVSTSARKNNLETQKQVLELYCAAKGWNYEMIEDIGSGLNYKKKGLTQLLKLIETNQVERVVINYKDRLVRFGYELIELMCRAHQTELIVISDTESKTYEEELAEDVLSVITVFSAKLYGSRSHKNKKIVEENKKLFS